MKDITNGNTYSDDLALALGIRSEEKQELVSIVGGGGKSALLFAFGRTLGGRCVLTTTTRIFANQLRRASFSCSLSDPDIEQMLADATSRSHPNGFLVIGEIDGEKARGVPADWPGQLIARDGIDFVIVEADGSRMRPTKAPAEHEPVIPTETTSLIVVAGIDALTGPISATCHRPERVCQLLGVEQDSTLRPEQLAELMTHPRGGLKSAPAGARVCLLLNKVESPSEQERAAEIARCALSVPRIDRVVVGALEPTEHGRPTTASSPGTGPWTIYRPDS